MGIARKGVGVSTLAQMFWDQIFRSVIIMHPGVHFIFCHIQISTRVLQVELFRGYYLYCMHI